MEETEQAIRDDNYKLRNKLQVGRTYGLQGSEQDGKQGSMENVENDSQSHKGQNVRWTKSEWGGKE